MKRHNLFWILAAVLLLAAAQPADARKAQKVKGEVVRVETNLQAENGATFDRLTIRTRQGEQLQLHLGQGGACEGCFQVGDQVRARVMDQAHEASGAHGVRSIQVRRGGEKHGFRNEDGSLVRGERGGRSGSAVRGGGVGDRDRQRIHTPGTGGGTGRGQRGGGGHG